MDERLLQRIGMREPPPAGVAGLRAVHRAFVGAVPFEALAVQLGESGPLDPDALTARILHGGRGGYCFEVNEVLARLLEGLGFSVERREGVVGGREDAWLTNHLTLVVHTDDGPFVADAGLGEGLLEPLPLTPGRVVAGPLHADVERDGEGWWVGLHPHASSPGFRIAGAPAAQGAFDAHHERLSRSPDSPFVRTLVVQRPMADRIVTLRARTLSVAGPGVGCRRVLADRAEFGAVLQRAFGIDPDALGRERLARLWAQARAQHEARGTVPGG